MKEVLDNFNKTRINIGHQHDRWMELKDALRVQTQKNNENMHFGRISPNDV